MASSLVQSATDLLKQLEPLEKVSVTVTKDAQAQMQKYRSFAMSLADSWSKVPLGYLTELYYGAYEKPPAPDEIDPRFGGSLHLSPKWGSRSPGDIYQEVTRRAGFNIVQAKERLEKLLEKTAVLRTDLLVRMSVVRDLKGLTSEKKLLNDIEQFDFLRNDAYVAFRKNDLPLAIVSLDSKASAQRVKTPPHQDVAAYVYQLENQCKAVREFLEVSGRFLRQIIERGEDSLVESQGGVSGHLALVERICRRLSFAAQPLRKRRANHQPLLISDEYDVQDLLHAILRVHFDDVRPEEYTPSYGSKSTRMDFLLKDEQLAVEAKMTGNSLQEKQVLEQLAIDAAYYKQHPNCKALVCLVYDPERRIGNPKGMEKDIGGLSTPELRVVGIVCS
jgi:REase_DpnII-MboI